MMALGISQGQAQEWSKWTDSGKFKSRTKDAVYVTEDKSPVYFEDKTPVNIDLQTGTLKGTFNLPGAVKAIYQHEVEFVIAGDQVQPVQLVGIGCNGVPMNDGQLQDFYYLHGLDIDKPVTLKLVPAHTGDNGHRLIAYYDLQQQGKWTWEVAGNINGQVQK